MAAPLPFLSEEILRQAGEEWVGMNCDDCAIDAMRAAAAKVLLEKATEIAETLVSKAIEGSERCLKVLCELAAEHKEQQAILERKQKPRRSLATEWANEPEWTEEDERAAKAAECGQMSTTQF